MVSGNSVNAIFRLQAAELGFEFLQLFVLSVPLKHISSNQNDIRVCSVDLFDKPLH